MIYNSGGTENCLTPVLRANTYLYMSPTRIVPCVYFSNMFADVKTEEGKKNYGALYVSGNNMLFDDEAKTKYVTDLQMSR